MEAHPLPLGRRQRRGLVPDPVLDAHPAEVVDERRRAAGLARRVVEPGVTARCPGELGDSAGMTADPRRLEVGEVGERGKCGIHRARLDGGRRPRLAGEGGLPLVGAVERGEDVRPDPLERIDDRRVVPPAAPLAQPPARIVARSGSQVGVPRRHDHADGHGDRVARQPGRVPLPVPALVRVGERLDDRRLEADPAREHRADLAVRGQRPCPALRVGEPAGDEPQPTQARLPGSDAADVPREKLAGEPATTGAIAAL